MMSTEQQRAGCSLELVVSADSGRFLLTSAHSEGVHRGDALRGIVLSDLEESPQVERERALLQALWLEGGPLVGRADKRSEAQAQKARQHFRAGDYDAANEIIEAAEIAWSVERIARLGSWRARGDVLQQSVEAYSLKLERPYSIEGEELVWHESEALQSEWRHGSRFVGPVLGQILNQGLQVRAFEGVSAWRVTPQIEMLAVRTPTLPPATHTNTFIIGQERAILLEPASPYPEELDLIVEWVEQRKKGGTQFEAIAVTHHHPDHVGGARALQERLGLPLWGHAQTAELLKGELVFKRLIEDTEVVELENGHAFALRALHTPGHAPGHLCFVDEESGVMLAGDMVAGVGTIIVEPVDGDMQLYLDSLRAMHAQEPRALLPAHGGLIRDPGAHLEHYIAHRLMREQKVLDALAEAKSEAMILELVPVVYSDTPEAAWPLAERSLEAHLIKLEREGRASRQAQTWQIV